MVTVYTTDIPEDSQFAPGTSPGPNKKNSPEATIDFRI